MLLNNICLICYIYKPAFLKCNCKNRNPKFRVHLFAVIAPNMQQATRTPMEVNMAPNSSQIRF